MIVDINVHPSTQRDTMTIEARSLNGARNGVLWLVLRNVGSDERLAEVTLFMRNAPLAERLAAAITATVSLCPPVPDTTITEHTTEVTIDGVRFVRADMPPAPIEEQPNGENI